MFNIDNLINAFSSLPGVGKKSAARLTYYLLKNKHKAKEISYVISEVIDNITSCRICGNYTVNNPCELCMSSDRDDSILCVIEDPRDLSAIEETGLYRGQYHILMGNINPLEGMNPDKLRIRELLDRLETGHFSELLIATNPTTEGEATFLYLANILKDKTIKISRLATGIPMGGSLEYSDRLTLSKAIQLKQYVDK